MSYKIATFYKFIDWPDFADFRQPLLKFCKQNSIKGTVLLASEGINSTITGTETDLIKVIEFLESHAKPGKLDVKISDNTYMPFRRMKVKLKKEIVTMGVPTVDPIETVGTYVEPTDWNALVSDPEVTVIDTRNDYEVEVGSFKGAQNPNTETFREFPDYVAKNLDPAKHKKIALYCTGGIRCEKATSYLRTQGFDDVYHLKGGILKYLENVPEEQTQWQGECYVFDDRVAVKHKLEVGNHTKCKGCGMPLAPEDLESKHYVPDLSCAKCHVRLTPSRLKRLLDRRRSEKVNSAPN